MLCNRFILVLVCFSSLVACRSNTQHQGTKLQLAQPKDTPSVWVDPFIGTADGDSPDPPPGDKGGAVFPGATVPFGMIQWSPDTGPSSEFSYHYDDRFIKGFSVNHISGPGCPALLDFPFLPITTALAESPSKNMEALWAEFRHSDEKAAPGRYSVRTKAGLSVELTARPRAGFARISYPVDAARGLLIEAGKTAGTVTSGRLQVLSSHRIVGSLNSEGFCGGGAFKGAYRVHIAVHFDQAITQSTWYGKDTWKVGAKVSESPSHGLYLRFSDDSGAPLHATVAISYVSTNNALANLDESMKDAGFERVQKEAEATWNQYLRRIRIEGGSESDQRTFYTALYHTLLHPNIFSDVNGEFMGFDGLAHVARGYTQYANYSGWDIYRSWIQLMALIAPKETRDIMRSFVVNAQQCGALPRWTLANDETGVMVGDPGSLLVANAHAFGVRGFDERAALALMKQAATGQTVRCNKSIMRPAQSIYNEVGYLPMDAKEAGWGPTSTTLEYAAADFAIAKFSESLGDRATAALHLERSRNWRNVFNPATGYVQPRARDGQWQPNFDPSKHDGYVEGNAAQYTFFVPHDAAGLIQALGGAEAAVQRLNALFTQLNSGLSQPYFYIGNEPQFGTPWLYNYAGHPWQTQEVVNKILTRTFTDKPGGLPGNDDLGATSSWFVWASLGLYPDVPGVGRLSVNTPRFPRATVTLPGDKALVITANGVNPQSFYIQSKRINGRPWDNFWLDLKQIQNGANIDFTVSATPNTR